MTQSEMEEAVTKVGGVGGMTVNERLYITGLMDEYDNAIKRDKHKAKTILTLLGVDRDSVDEIVT
ncbi:hypothetical protein [Sphingobacterium corticibacter]|uniref:Uncharacterized protein n=1 Tax=Sphingobacterium corticibacter TaxID=2171749 RepID=A0A2T8HEU5_9SPHI|nr:hypothetical protein [Sphingobacterium corticibacter]PVH23957.1 hypothetical protein DC487_16025 [Sphingobacterium corticibacter]